MALTSTHLLAYTIVVAVVLLRWRASKPRLPLPPGPYRLPLIGTIDKAPQTNPWRTYQKWTRRYGPIVYLRYGPQDIIILGNAKSADDLLNKRGKIYSDRPRLVMGAECLSKGRRILLMPYGPKYRDHQKIMSTHLNFKDSNSYRPLQDLESRQLLLGMLSTNDFQSQIQRYTASLTFSFLYGKRLPTGREVEIESVKTINYRFLLAGQVGAWIVDLIPVLNYLPRSLAPWKRTADEWHAFESCFYQDCLSRARESKTWNYSKQALSTAEARKMQPIDIAYDMGVIYEAATDTTFMALETFIMAAVLHPDVMRTARKELDEVVGPSRIPSFEDRSRLPYIEAIMKELMRWRPVTAGGVPHAIAQEDEYMGYRIPKGATVIGNHWSISLDEDVFDQPYDFEPQRWLDSPNMPEVGFGFGRRVCTGQHVARNSLFIVIARLLWGFEIVHQYDAAGNRIEIDNMAMTQGFTSGPMPFLAKFKVRGEGRRKVIEEAWEGAEKDVDKLLEKIASSMGYRSTSTADQ